MLEAHLQTYRVLMVRKHKDASFAPDSQYCTVDYFSLDRDLISPSSYVNFVFRINNQIPQ